jgi:hypothetical protein
LHNSFPQTILPLLAPGVPVVPADYFVLQVMDGNARISFFPLSHAIAAQTREQMAMPPGIRIEEQDPLELPPGAMILFNPNGLLALVNLVSEQLLKNLEDPGLSASARLVLKEALSAPNTCNLPEVLKRLSESLEILQS